jgi:hypothetical protein
MLVRTCVWVRVNGRWHVLVRQKFGKSSNMKFHPNPSRGSGVVSRGQTDERTNGRIDMTKLIVAFRNFTDAPKNEGCPKFRRVTRTYIFIHLRQDVTKPTAVRFVLGAMDINVLKS